jgi:transcriptional regulator with XRE-family HTH domain
MNLRQKIKAYKLKIEPYRLKTARQARGFDLEEFAKLLDVKVNTLEQYESGELELPTELLFVYIKELEFPAMFFYKDISEDMKAIEKGPFFLCGSGGCSVMVNGKWYPE